jgi:hypothetical protein
MTMTMFYVHVISKKTDLHINIPARNAREAYDYFKQEVGKDATVTQIVPLFHFEYDEEKNIVGVN